MNFEQMTRLLQHVNHKADDSFGYLKFYDDHSGGYYSNEDELIFDFESEDDFLNQVERFCNEPRYKVEFRHYRFHVETELPESGHPIRLDRPIPRYARKEPPFEPSPKGGATVCIIKDGNGKLLSAGWAFCSFSDNFNYATGRKIAHERAMENLG